MENEIGIPPEILEMIVCPSCKSDLLLKDTTLECSNCKEVFGTKNNIPILISKRKMSEHRIEKEVDLFDQMKIGHESLSKNIWKESKKEFFKTLKKNAVTFDNKKILNVGCGRDDLFHEIKKNNNCCYIDLDLVYNALLEIRNNGHDHLVNSDVRNLPFKANSFDIVFCIDLIHHFYAEGIDKPVEEMLRVLEDNGTILIEEVNKFAVYRLPIYFLPHSMLLYLRKSVKIVANNKRGPVDYEAPLSPFKVYNLLSVKGIKDLNFEPLKKYPLNNRILLKIFNVLSISQFVQKYLSYHWLIVGRK